MKPKFTICRFGAQEKVPDVGCIIKQSDLEKICQTLTGQSSFEVEWIDKRIKGKLFRLETENKIFFITYTPKEVGGRNSYLQSVPTAFSLYINSLNDSLKECSFCLYFTPCNGNNQTRYHKFMYKLLKSIGVQFINPEEGLRGLTITKFDSVASLISTRNDISARNRYNQSSYITDEGHSYYVYGKTFGANQKETTLICLALCRVADKSIKLFQISDNTSNYLSESDINSIKDFADRYGGTKIEILDDSYEFSEDNEPRQPISNEENLRDPRFIFNLLEKTGGHKRCSLCGCEIESIIQGAHIYPVHAIKRRNDLTYNERLIMATDKDNGVWLCENHHKLFDRGLIKFDSDGNMQTLPKLTESEANFVDMISTHKQIEPSYYNANMVRYFNLRDSFYHTEGYY